MKILEGKAQLEFETNFTTIPELLDYCLAKYPQQSAYWYRAPGSKETKRKSYRELKADIEAFSVGLRALRTLGPQNNKRLLPDSPEHLAIVGQNSYPWVVVHNAALFGLGIAVPLDKQLAAHEIANLCQRGRVGVLTFDSDHMEAALLAAQGNPALHTLILTDTVPNWADLQQQDERLLSFEQILAQGYALLAKDPQRYQLVPVKPQPDEVAAIYFTSGTTNQAKGVMLSQHNIIANIKQGVRSIYIPAGGRALSVLPLHHTFEGSVGMYCLWAVGVCICLNENLRSFASNLKDWKINMVLVVPLMLQGIYRQVQRGIAKSGKSKQIALALKLSRFLRKLGIDVRRRLFQPLLEPLGGEIQLFVCGAAALAPEIQRFFTDIGVLCLCGYGLTETAPILSACTQNYLEMGSVGTPLCGVTLAIDSAQGGDSPETAGEILAKGANVMLGYYENPSATAAVIDDDGWFHTGDLGYISPGNCLYITGRAKSLIVLSNGKKVFPEELEALLSEIAGLKSALVWGESNKRGAVELSLRLQVDREALPQGLDKTDDEQIGQWLAGVVERFNQQMTEYKRIQNYVWDDSEPIMTTTLKIKRREELERLQAALEATGLSLNNCSGQRLRLS